jgi:hypothetical protein
MTKVKVEKFLVISFIGLIVTFFVGLGGNIILKAGLPVSVKKTEVDFEKRLQLLDDDLAAGNISRHTYDSIAGNLEKQKEQIISFENENHNPDRIPDWVIALGIKEPEGMKFVKVFSDYTSIENPSEGFNSVSLVYTGSYASAVEQAAKIAESAKLTLGGDFKAKGRPTSKAIPEINSAISYLNYSLGDAEQDFLISVQVEPSGRLTIMVTDSKQLKERLLAYEPLNNHRNNAAKQKKQ